MHKGKHLVGELLLLVPRTAIAIITATWRMVGANFGLLGNHTNASRYRDDVILEADYFVYL